MWRRSSVATTIREYVIGSKTNSRRMQIDQGANWCARQWKAGARWGWYFSNLSPAFYAEDESYRALQGGREQIPGQYNLHMRSGAAGA